jgi:hypothetical protein
MAYPALASPVIYRIALVENVSLDEESTTPSRRHR